MRDLIELAEFAWNVLLVLATFALAALFIIRAAIAYIALKNSLDRRREAIRALDDARRERQLLDQLAPAPDGTVPPESLAVGRARLATELATPDADQLQALYDLPPAEEDR